MWLLSLLWGCYSDHFLSHGVTEERIEYVYIQDNYIAGSDDTGERDPIWVDSFTQPSISNGVDILWVIDGSGSMRNDEPKILAGISDMLANLPMLNWRLMIISMTPSESAGNVSFPLLPGDTYMDALSMFSNNVTLGFELGFESVYQFMTNNSYALSWMRSDAALLVVFVSDEPEQSTSVFPSVYDFQTWIDTQRNEVKIASIVNLPPDESVCNGYTHTIGTRYIDIANLYGGQVIDICSDDWSQGVSDATNQITLRSHYDLSMTPLNPDHIYVFVDGIEFTGWGYNEVENRIYFSDIPREESLVEIAYYY
jgi:hypothetical protein